MGTRRLTLGDRAFAFVLSATVLLSLAGQIGHLGWLFELTSHFKLQYWVIGGVSLIFFVFRRRPVGISLSLACLILNAIALVPWYWDEQDNASGLSAPIRVLVANVNAENRNYDKAIAFVKQVDPDIAAFVEVTREWRSHLEAIQDTLPHAFVKTREDSFGIAVYSRSPLIDPTLKFFPNSETGSILTKINYMGKATFSLLVTHPLPPFNPDYLKARDRHLSAVADYIRQNPTTWVVVGDLNTTMWSPQYRQFEEIANLKNARSGFGILPTWPVRFPPLYIPIDHCLTTFNIRILDIQTGADIGSDHLPLVIELSIDPIDR
jgi:endonuclease/exonuclease/phosphatase (EEP) superfamily protein YafD